MAISTGNTVTIEFTGRLADGTVFDTSQPSVAAEAGLVDEQPDREFEPLTLEVGSGRIIEGLEDAIRGLEAGDERTVTIEPDEGYGEHAEDRIVSYDAPEFREMLDGREPTEGMTVRTEDGLPGSVIAVGEDVVRVDFNHGLAGETLEFDIEILEVD